MRWPLSALSTFWQTASSGVVHGRALFLFLPLLSASPDVSPGPRNSFFHFNYRRQEAPASLGMYYGTKTVFYGIFFYVYWPLCWCGSEFGLVLLAPAPRAPTVRAPTSRRLTLRHPFPGLTTR